MTTSNINTWSSRLSICYTIPHLIAALSFLIVTVYIAVTVRAEDARHRQTHLASRAALVYQTDDIQALTTSLVSLNQHLRPTYHLIILHSSLTPSAQARLQALSNSPITFRQLVSPNLNNHTIPANLPNITAFWSLLPLLHHPTASLFPDVDYIIRLSSRTIFPSVNQDLINSFVAQGTQYAYHKITNHCHNVTSLRQLAISYVDLNRIHPRCQPLWQQLLNSPCLPAFSGSFEFLNLSFFRSHSGIQDFLRLVHANRPLIPTSPHEGLVTYITVALYATPEKVTQFEKLVPFRIT